MRLAYGFLKEDKLAQEAHNHRKRPPFSIKEIGKNYADVCTWASAIENFKEGALRSGYNVVNISSTSDIDIPHISELNGAVVSLGPTSFFHREFNGYPYYHPEYFWHSAINLWNHTVGHRLPFDAKQASMYCPVVYMQTYPTKLQLRKDNYLPAFTGEIRHVFNQEVKMEYRYLLAELLVTVSFAGVGRKTAWGAGQVDLNFQVTPVAITYPFG
jgi:hypothetical protein